MWRPLKMWWQYGGSGERVQMVATLLDPMEERLVHVLPALVQCDEVVEELHSELQILGTIFPRDEIELEVDRFDAVAGIAQLEAARFVRDHRAAVLLGNFGRDDMNSGRRRADEIRDRRFMIRPHERVATDESVEPFDAAISDFQQHDVRWFHSPLPGIGF